MPTPTLEGYLNNVDLQRLDLRALAVRASGQLGWPETLIAEAIDHYRKFLYLQLCEEGYYLIPPDYVDAIWGAHMSDLESYVRETAMIFGRPLNHYSTTLAYQSEPSGRPLHFIMMKARFLSVFGIEIQHRDPSSRESGVDDIRIRKYHEDMLQKFLHTNSNSHSLFFMNYDNRIGPY